MRRRTFLAHGLAATGIACRRPWAAAAPADVGLSTLSTPPDPARSSFTGYSRAHWLEIAERILAGILPHLDSSTGLPHLHGVAGEWGHDALYNVNPLVGKWQAMERIMMLAVYYTAATGRDRIPGWAGSVTEVFRTGIRRMTNPADPLFCPRTDPSAYLGSETALAALVSPRHFWEPFAPAERARLLDFAAALALQQSYDNNHHLFHLVPVPLLEREGRESFRARLAPRIDLMLSWQRGDGWFIDGSNRGFDHYNAWGFFLYLNALAHLDRPWGARYGERIRRATAEFLALLPWFFGRDGGPIPWGRSLAYRFAHLSAIGWAHLHGANPLAPGLARRLASGCLQYFWDRGALARSGVLELGYHGPNAALAEPYLTHGTGYFAVQAFACLLIPETDPFWTAPEEPLPADGRGGRRALRGAGMAVRVSPVDGEARLFIGGQPFGHLNRWQRGSKYAQHAYSSAVGWCALGEGGEDLGAGRCGYSFDGQSWTYRSQPRATFVGPDEVASREPLAAGAASGPAVGELCTHTLIGDTGEVHVLWHTHARPIHLHLGGYGISVAPGAKPEIAGQPEHIHLHAGDYHSWMRAVHGPAGDFDSRVLAPRAGWLHSHLFGGRGAFPYWRSRETVAAFVPLVFHVDGSRGRAPDRPKLSVRTVSRGLEISFGDRAFTIELLPPARASNP